MNKAGLVLAALLLACSLTGQAADVPARPNILLILLDDAGYGDIAGFAHSKAPTPNLKQLGDQGVRFTRFYADSTCRPARLSLLTGEQASRIALAPDFHGISPEVETLPEKLQQAGYSTYHVGKWHVGDTTPLSWPSHQGFDHWFGFLHQFVLRGPAPDGGMGLHRPTYINPWLQEDDAAPRQYQGHLEDILADRVVAQIQSLKKSRAPWFINYWTLAPHNPATPSESYRQKFPNDKAGQYAALLNQMDAEIGRVLKALDETGQAENTIVLVLSDNGGTNELSDNNGPFEGEKGHYSEGGTRTPMIIRWPGHFAAGSRYTGIAAIYDIYPTLLAAAKAPVGDASAFDGIDLARALQGRSPVVRKDLFWETGDDYNYSWSVLGGDGRWRLDEGHLFDLQKDPYAKEDVANLYPERVNELRQAFLAWRKVVHHLDLKTERLTQAGLPPAWRISGDSFRRTPGYGGFTVVTSITAPAGAPAQGTLFEQAGIWSMSLSADQRIHLRLHDQDLVSKPVTLRGCTPLVFSTYYYRSKLQPHQDHAAWYLRVGEEEVLLEKRPAPTVFPEHFLEPTFAGQGADGRNRFTGTLEKPGFYNDFYYSNDPWKVERDPLWLAATVCRPPGH